MRNRTPQPVEPAPLGLPGLLAVLVLTAACSTERATPRPVPTAAQPATPEAEPAAPTAEPAPAVAHNRATDAEERNLLQPAQERNPFEPFQQLALPPPIDPPVGPDPLFAELSLDELRLIGIVSGAGQPARAMLVAPDGDGEVVSRGDSVGRGELYRPAPNTPGVEVNWRVARIRPDRIVFVRSNPLFPDRQATHILRLHPES